MKVPSGGCTLLRVCIIVLVCWERMGTVVTRLLAAHAIACCSRLALSCRLVPQLSFQQLGLAVSPGCCSEWWWLCRGSAMRRLRCMPQQEASGDRLQVPRVRCMPHGACSTLPPWQEREGHGREPYHCIWSFRLKAPACDAVLHHPYIAESATEPQ